VLPFPSERADAVVLLDVLAHLDDPRAAVREAARTLVPGGRILVKTPHRPSWAYWLAARLPGGVGRGLMHLPHQRHAISRPGLKALLVAAGFDRVEIEASGEAIPLSSRLTGSWASRAKVLLVAALELFYGGRSTVATGTLGPASTP
jgi:SAM-dependent methyltransferase